MCGIAGLLRPTEFSPDELDSVLSQLKHRGPDGQSAITLRSSCHHLAFCHARLSIIDLTTAADQPMIDDATGCTLIFNGEIYNYLDLRAEISKVDPRPFTSTGDSEVLLRAYLIYGPSFIQQLRGMFAFALYDPRQQTLLLARDHFGIKPLYYTQTGDTFAFASEVRTLFAVPGVSRRLHQRGLLGYLSYGSVQEPDTLVEGIHSLPAGHYALLDLRTTALPAIHAQRFWTLPNQLDPHISPQEAQERVYQSLSDSVQAHLISDVNIGVFLSGGLDSMALVALMSRHIPQHVRTLTVAFDEADFDESAQAGAIAAHFKTQHLEVRLRAEDFLDDVSAWLASYDLPSSDGANVWVISQACHQAGLKVALTGLGGDELFAGYSTFRQTQQAARLLAGLRNLPGWTRQLAAGAIQSVGGSTALSQKTGDLLGSDGSALQAYLSTRKLFTRHMRSRLVDFELEEEFAPGVEADLAHLIAGGDVVAGVSLLEMSTYMRNTLLRDSDQMGMAHSIELRVPFVDRLVAEAVLALPGAMRLNGTGSKPFLRDVIKNDVLADWLHTPKRGFAFPFDRWLRGPLKSIVAASLEILKDRPFRSQAVQHTWTQFLNGSSAYNAGRIMTLFVLAAWLQQHNIAMSD